jgi:hypothetical protein
MRYALVLTVAALVAPAGFAADPPKGAGPAAPPITFQTQPLDRVLSDMRAAADLVGGQKAVKEFNEIIKEQFGEKGFEGLDISRPVVGYVILAPKPQDITAVLVLPITGEKEFLALCDRTNSVKHKDLGKGLYQLPPLDPRYKARVRFSEGHAYLAYGFNPEPALDPKALVPAGKLYDPAEQAIVAAKFHFDRLTPEVKKAIPAYIAEVKKEMGLDGNGVLFGLGAAERQLFAGAGKELEKMFARYLLLLGGADTATVRLNIDVPTSDLIVEATLTPRPNTALAKEIREFKPTGNRFAGLLTPDTVVGFKVRLPFLNDELKSAGVKVLEEGQRLAGNTVPPVGKATTDELFKGLIRTVKAGEADIAGGIRGPDKNGDFALVGAIACDDTAALEKEFKKFFKADAPPGEQDRMKWDAAKAGNVNIHTFKLQTGGFFDISKPFGAEKASLAFAFAPKGIFVVIGTDPVTVMKDALGVKPTESPILDVVLNPSRMVKFVEKTGGRPGDVERALGKQDKLISAMSLRVTGGKDLSVKYTLNLRLLPKALIVDNIEATEKAEAIEKK